MAQVTVAELTASLERIQAQLADMSQRLQVFENGKGAAGAMARPKAAEPAQSGIKEEELLAISACIGAYLGVRAHIRQIRLVSSNAWAQEGRVSIQASHRLQA